jgi:hypothetical protein
VNNPARAAGLEIRRAGDDVLVHDAAHDKVHVLNGTAGYVLERCDGTRSVSEIARSISETTHADATLVERDVAAIVRDFQGLGLLGA